MVIVQGISEAVSKGVLCCVCYIFLFSVGFLFFFLFVFLVVVLFKRAFVVSVVPASTCSKGRAE